MTQRSLILSCRFGILVLITTFMFGASGASLAQETDLSDQLPEGMGKSYVQSLCTPCHGLGLTVSQRMTREGWEASTYDMLGRLSAGMDQEAEIITDYLSEHFGVEPATSHGEDQTQLVADSPIRVYQQMVFSFTDEATEEERRGVMDSGREMLANISVVVSALVGRITPGDPKFQYGFVTGFTSEADLVEFRIHPDYLKWMQESFRPFVSRSSITEIVAEE